jgi:OmpA-OmpF porin, OOP family
MSKKSSYLLGILLTIGLGMLLYHHFCCGEKDKVTTPSEATATNAPMESIFALKGKDLDYHCNGNFNFLNDSFKSIMPVDECVDLGISQLKTVLEKGGQKFNITGYCLSSEKNTSAYENLGLARANDVKNYFVSKGIPSNLITTIGEIKDDGVLQKDGTLYGPVSFMLSEVTAETKTEDWNALKEKINANPLIMYFNTGQASIDLSAEDRKKVTDMVHYLDNVAAAKLDVTGYTDNVGKVVSNVKLGQERADFAKAYLVSNGISAERINSASKGPESPIADNTTAEGRAKNRRTEVKIN